MTTRTADELRAAVRDRYGRIATSEAPGCGCGSTGGGGRGGCCDDTSTSERRGKMMGYSDAELSTVPEGANLGLGCGNPQAIASLEPGETVLDLGSGGGFDCFLAAHQVGKIGQVIGVDMTPEMIAKARKNATEAGLENVSFRLGEIEHPPVESDSVDIVMSNCVINLSPDKQQVYREAFRVLRPGGRLAISDVVLAASLPESLQDNLVAYAGCVSGAVSTSDVEQMLADAGFVDISVRPQDERRELVREWSPRTDVDDYVVSALIEARKPA